VHLPAYFALILWGLLQIIGATKQLAGMSNVSALAHLGGAAVGFIAWLLWRNR
jgi:membrane associated rhomboid family serine protease